MFQVGDLAFQHIIHELDVLTECWPILTSYSLTWLLHRIVFYFESFKYFRFESIQVTGNSVCIEEQDHQIQEYNNIINCY